MRSSRRHSTLSWIRHHAASCFLLLVPVLLWNLVLTGCLPSAFQSAEFWRDIPSWVSVPENVLRSLVLLLPLLAPLELSSRTQRVRLAWFTASVAVYFASWIALMAWPASTWSTSAAGFLAPACTPALWLFWMGMLFPDRRFLPWLPFRRWAYFVVAGLFLVFHNLHTAIVYSRNLAIVR